MGGHELDRWHIGEEKALGAKMEEEVGERAAKRVRVDEEAGLPGLSNFAVPANGDGYPSKSSASLPGLGVLPGLGGPMIRQWGATDGAGGFPRSQGPLPSQDEMLRKVGAGDRYEDRRDGSGAANGGQGGYGGGQNGYGGGQNGYGGSGGGGYANGGGGGYR